MKKKLLLGAVVLSMAMAFTACGSASSNLVAKKLQ